MSRSLYSLLHSRFGPALSPAEREAQLKELRLKTERWQAPSLSATCLAKLAKTSVAVVGGGFAGLLAARQLCRTGADVTVFEAHKEVGGRVRSDKTFNAGDITEAGAELIGSFHYMWRRLAIEYGLAWIGRMDGELHAKAGLEMRVWLDKLLNSKELKDLEEDMRQKVLIPFSKDAETIIDPSQPWAQKTNEDKIEKWDNMSVADRLKDLGITESNPKTRRLWMAMDLQLRNNNVAPLDEINYLGLLCLVKAGKLSDEDKLLMGYWDELEIFRCADGSQQLAIKMAADIESHKDRGKILLNTAVTAIDISKDASKKRVTLKSAPVKKIVNNEPVLGEPVTYKKGFDYVILAIPPSVWYRVTITPHHPLNTIGKMGMGPATKFFSNVGKRFWVKHRAAPLGGMWRQDRKMGQVWEGSDNQTQPGGQGIVLSVFTGGGPTPEEKDFKDGLEELYPDYKKNLEDYKKKFPRKASTMLVDWSAEPFIKTGYASPRKGKGKGKGKGPILTIGRELREPYLGRLFFAGEHTQMDSFGYMEGALRSGERAANAVINQVCRPAEELVAARVRPAARTAGAAMTRESLVLQQPDEALLEGHTSAERDLWDSESPFLDQEFFASPTGEKWEMEAKTIAAESPFVNELDGYRNGIDESQLEEQHMPEDEEWKPEETHDDFTGEEEELDEYTWDEELKDKPFNEESAGQEFDEIEEKESQGMLPDETQGLEIESEILGTNDMTWVSNSLAVPHRWICRLDIEYEVTAWGKSTKRKGHGRGTGTLIGTRHVLTAAHNLYSYDPNGKNYLRATHIRVTPAHDGSGAPPVAGIEADLAGSHVHPNWKISRRVDSKGTPNPAGEVETNQFDYALLTLKTSIGGRHVKGLNGPLGCWENNGSGGRAQLRRLDPKVLASNDVFVAGYGNDACVKAVRIAVSDNTIPLGSQLQAAGQIKLVKEAHGKNTYVSRSMAHNVDTCGGQSGAPVWIERDSVFYLVGVHTSAVSMSDGGRMNHAVRITRELVEQVRNWQSDGLVSPELEQENVGEEQEMIFDHDESE